MESLIRLLVAVIELMEAEGRVLRRHLAIMLAVTGIGLVMLLASMAAVVFLMYSIFVTLAHYLTPAGAAPICAIILLLVAWGGKALIIRLLEIKK